MITKDNEANEVIRYYHEDALGSFIAMTDEHQNLTALYQYDAWGNELLTQVSALSSPPSENPYRWCGAWGYYRDRDAQMYLLGMRWYDPQTGRFISRDPIGLEGGDGNFFRYVINSPTMWSDPSGLIGRGWPKDCADVFDPAGLNWAKDLAQNIRNRFPRYVNSPDHRHYDVLKRACEGLYRTLKLIAECSGERSPAAAAALQAALPFFEKAKSLCDKLQPPSSGSPPVPVVDPVLSPSPARAPAPNTPPLWLRILGIGVSVGGRIISLPFLFIPSEFLPMPPDEPPQA
jgi:RHS repeat-associated protein